MNYIYYALLTVVCWGTYGICMHTGSVNMKDAENGRIMAFLWVGIAYFITAVLAPLIILYFNKEGSIAPWTTSPLLQNAYPSQHPTGPIGQWHQPQLS